MRLLVVEDSARLQKTLGTVLRRSGYAVDQSLDGEQALWMATSNDYDLIILDVMLPRLDGLTLLSRLRAAGQKVHVLLLTAKDSVADRVNGLRAGGDDYLVKPFALQELLARIEALCRRAYGQKHPALEIGDLVLDTSHRTVHRAGRAVELTAREYLLLEYLARRRGEVVSRTEIEDHIYDGQVDPVSNVIDSTICALRKKIAPGGEASLIHTRRGMGYVLET